MENIENVVTEVSEAVAAKSEGLIGGFSKKELGVGAGLIAGGGLIVEGAHQLIKHRPISRFVGKVRRFIAFESKKEAKVEEEPNNDENNSNNNEEK